MAKTKTYLARKTEDYYILVEASSEEEALEKAESIEWANWEFSDASIEVELHSYLNPSSLLSEEQLAEAEQIVSEMIDEKDLELVLAYYHYPHSLSDIERRYLLAKYKEYVLKRAGLQP